MAASSAMVEALGKSGICVFFCWLSLHWVCYLAAVLHNLGHHLATNISKDGEGNLVVESVRHST